MYCSYRLAPGPGGPGIPTPTLQPWTDTPLRQLLLRLTHSHPRVHDSTPSLHEAAELHRPWPRARTGEPAEC